MNTTATRTMVTRKFPSLYRTAEVLHSGTFYRVLGQNRAGKEASTHLALEVDGYTRWFPIAELRPCL